MSNHRSCVFALAAVSTLAAAGLASTSAFAMHAGFGGGGLGGGGSGQAASIGRTSGGLGGGGSGQAANIGRASSGGLGQSSFTHKGSTRRGLIVTVHPQGQLGTPNILLRTPVVPVGTPNVQIGTPVVPLGPPNVQLGTPNVQLGTPVVPLGPPNVQIGTPLIPIIPPGKPPCEGFCGPILPPPVVAGPDPHGHPGFEWHHPHWGIAGDPAPVAVETVAVDTVATPAPCNCLTKQYLDDGSVLFKDLCTKEAAMATPDELRAQAQGAALQAQ
jgi:hypothetical protein